MKNFTLICLIIFSGFSNAQFYKPLTLEGRVIKDYATQDAMGTTNYYEFIFEGTFEMNGLTYFKRLTSNGGENMVGVRQDTILKKIYYLGLDNIETEISFDFDANEGDTILFSPNYTNALDRGAILSSTDFLELDSVVIVEKNTDFYELQSINADYQYAVTYRNGIGYTSLNHFEYVIFTICQNENDSIVYGSYLNPYCAWTATTLNLDQKDVKIYPTLASNQIVMELSMELSSATVSIFDSCGKLILVQEFDGNQKTLDITSFSKGSYIIHLKTNDNIIRKQFFKI